MIDNQGTIEGVGTIDATVSHNGIISPGSQLVTTTGTLTINGDLSMTGSGTLQMGITGIDLYDQLLVTGTATRGGTLEVGLGGNFTPTSGSSFAIMTYAGKTGDFVTVTLPGAQWTYVDSDSSVTVMFDSIPQHLLTVASLGAGSGTVTSTPIGINCGSTCSLFNEGTPVNLSATPTGGSIFTGWSGACTGAGVCQVTMSAPMIVGAGFSATSIPLLMSYQGYLTDAAGLPVEGALDMTFTLYRADSSALWTETHANVPVSKGIYGVMLGSITPLNTVLFNEPYFLGIKIGNDPEMGPRQPLSSVGYALRSAVTDSFSPGAVTSDSVSDGAITLDRLSGNCGVGQVLRQTASGWACGQAP